MNINRLLFSTLLSGLVLLLSACGDSGGGNSGGNPVDDYPYPTGRIFFPNLPVNIDQVVNFHGLGTLNPLPADHGAFFSPDMGIVAPTLPVFAVADGKIIEIRKNLLQVFEPYGDDLAIKLRVSTTIWVLYAHVSALSDEVLNAAGPLQVGNAVRNLVNIPVKAGQVIAYTGPQPAMDFHIKDQDVQLEFVNPSRYPPDELNSACYHDYWQEPLKSQLLDVTERQLEPRCGKIDFDVAGRLIGNWFLESETPPGPITDYSTVLSIVYGPIEADQIAISDAYAIREGWGASRIFWVNGNSPKPETVSTVSGLVKYEIMDAPPLSLFGPRPPLNPTIVGVFLMQMLEPDRIKVERVMGVTEDETVGFSDNARTYIR